MVGDAVCVEARVAGVWMRNSLRIVEFCEWEKCVSGGVLLLFGVRVKVWFVFVYGMFGGYLFAGEERFSVEFAEDGEVFYEVYVFSRFVYVLSVVSYLFV